MKMLKMLKMLLLINQHICPILAGVDQHLEQLMETQVEFGDTVASHTLLDLLIHGGGLTLKDIMTLCTSAFLTALIAVQID